MNPDKKIIIDSLVERINNSPFLIVTDFAGLKVDQFEELRNKLVEAGAEYHVTKNTYVKRAAAEAELPEEIGEMLTGQTAVVTGESDVCAAAKVLKDFHKDNEMPTVRGGALDGALLDAAGVSALASLPSREELLAKLLGTLMEPANSLARLLNEPGASLARVLQAKADKG